MAVKHTRGALPVSLLVATLVIAIFSVDVITGHEISFSIFYLIPIAVTTWYHSRTAGLLLSLFCAVGWLLGEQVSGATYSNGLIPVWNMLVRLGFFVVVTQTLATRRRMDAELIAARSAALAANEAKSEFVSRVTHELRTPLTAILGFADLLQKRSAPYMTEDDQECLRRIRINAQSLLSMVDGVLDVARTEVRAVRPALEAVDLVALLRTIESDIRSRPLPPGVQLVVEAAPQLARISTDPALLRQVLLNLVSNAVKFTDSGFVRLMVFSTEEGQPERIVVEDTGIGIPAERLEAIFAPFEQADGSIHRRFGGAGLGLTIAREICEVLGYDLRVMSTPGRGSAFTVVLGARPAATSPQLGRYAGV